MAKYKLFVKSTEDDEIIGGGEVVENDEQLFAFIGRWACSSFLEIDLIDKQGVMAYGADRLLAYTTSRKWYDADDIFCYRHHLPNGVLARGKIDGHIKVNIIVEKAE